MDINSWLNQVKKDESELKLFTTRLKLYLQKLDLKQYI